MGAGSFGSFMDAARSQSRFSSQLAHRLELLRLKTKANGGHEGSAAMESFDCFTLCQRCQRLGEPHDICPSCGDRASLDLRNFGYARWLQELEEDQRRTPPWWAKMAGYVASTTTFGLLLWGSLAVCGAMGSAGVVLFFASLGVWLGIAIAVGKWLRKPLARLCHPTHTATPLRWRQDAMAQGDGPGGALTAPLTKRPCRGYHLQIYLLDPEATHKAVWLLDEKVATAEVGAALERPGRPKPLADPELRLDQVERELFLRARGLTQDEGELLFCESIIA